MSYRRYARRVDANLSQITVAFRQLGCTVDVTNDKWDLTIGYGGLSILVEVKDSAKVASRRKLTPTQVKFRETWTGGIRLVTSFEDVQAAVNCLREWHAILLSASSRAQVAEAA